MKSSRPLTLHLTRPLFGGGVTMVFRRIPAGRFVMGTRGEFEYEEPPHEVEITRDYWMAETPLTQRQFAVWTKAEAAKIEHKNGFPDKPDHPAERMVWDQASAFCQWLTKRCRGGIPKGMVARLPTEAEWERACRAGTDSEYGSGDGVGALAEVGWFDKNSNSSTQPVRAKAANGFGLYDMHGNVWEWCADAFDGQAYAKRVNGVQDPFTVPREGDKDPGRVMRGGSWFGSAGDCRSAYRFRGGRGGRGRNLGFRVCLGRGPAEP